MDPDPVPGSKIVFVKLVRWQKKDKTDFCLVNNLLNLKILGSGSNNWKVWEKEHQSKRKKVKLKLGRAKCTILIPYFVEYRQQKWSFSETNVL